MNGKCEAHFLTKKNPRKFNWTVFYRRLHKKGTAEEVAKKRTRKTTKFQRAIVGASWEQIVAKREQPSAVRKAARDAASEAAKANKKSEETKKKTEKIKVEFMIIICRSNIFLLELECWSDPSNSIQVCQAGWWKACQCYLSLNNS